MNGHRTIEIDFAVHQRIEAARRSFAETPNAALRRMIGLADDVAPSRSSGDDRSDSLPARSSGSRPWAGKGGTLEGGAKLRMDHKGQRCEGEVVDGAWLVDGVTYRSPSDAAGGAVRPRAAPSRA